MNMRSGKFALAVCGSASILLTGCSSQDVICTNLFDCDPAPGFAWAEPGSLSYEVNWVPGAKHPAFLNITASDTPYNWQPNPGYVWASENPTSLAVRWGPGSQSFTHPNMRAGELIGQWLPDPGYKLVPDVRAGLAMVGNEPMRAQWDPGQAHPLYARTFATQTEGQWGIEAGYVRTNVYGARWQPGLAHPTQPNVVSGAQQGLWVPATGYEFASASGLEVVPAQTYLFGRTKAEADERFGRFLVGLTTVAIAASFSQSQKDDGVLMSNFARPAARVIRDDAIRDVYDTLTE